MNRVPLLLVEALVVLFSRGLLLFMTALALTRIRAMGARMRHTVWVLTMGGLLLLPLAWLLIPPVAPLMPLPPAMGPALQAAAAAVLLPPVVATLEASSAFPAGSATSAFPVGAIVFMVWLLVVLGLLTRSLSGRFRIRELTRSAVDTGAANAAAGLSLRHRVLATARCWVPFACGVIRPAIVLPLEWTGWTAARLRGVLLHEDAHLRRHDPLIQMCAEVVRALLWFVPMAWLAHRSMVRESERCCDAEVMRAGLDGAAYAADLVSLARVSNGQAFLRGTARAVGRGFLEERIQTLVRTGGKEGSGRRLPQRIALIGFTCLLPLFAVTCSKGPSEVEKLRTENAKLKEMLQSTAALSGAGVRVSNRELAVSAAIEALTRGIPTRWPTGAGGTRTVRRSFGWQETKGRPGFMHTGVDIAAPNGTPVLAAAAGKVVRLGVSSVHDPFLPDGRPAPPAKEITVQHAYFFTVYANVTPASDIKEGSTVQAGQVLGVVDNRIDPGHAFLHYTIQLGQDFKNPMPFLFWSASVSGAR